MNIARERAGPGIAQKQEYKNGTWKLPWGYPKIVNKL
jgi:hypothetical protein